MLKFFVQEADASIELGLVLFGRFYVKAADFIKRLINCDDAPIAKKKPRNPGRSRVRSESVNLS